MFGKRQRRPVLFAEYFHFDNEVAENHQDGVQCNRTTWHRRTLAVLFTVMYSYRDLKTMFKMDYNNSFSSFVYHLNETIKTILMICHITMYGFSYSDEDKFKFGFRAKKLNSVFLLHVDFEYRNTNKSPGRGNALLFQDELKIEMKIIHFAKSGKNITKNPYICLKMMSDFCPKDTSINCYFRCMWKMYINSICSSCLK